MGSEKGYFNPKSFKKTQKMKFFSFHQGLAEQGSHMLLGHLGALADLLHRRLAGLST